MASEQVINAIISVIDRTQQPMHRVEQRFSAMTAPIRRIGAGLAQIAEETGLKNIGERAKDALERVKGLGAGLMQLAGPLAALGAAGSVAGLVEIAKSTAEFGEQLHLSAVAAGLSTEQLAGWQFAAKLANVDAEQLGRGFQYLNRNVAMAAMGKSKDVQAILTRMGFHNSAGHLVATADALKAVAAEAKHLVDSGQVQAADAMMSQLFGQRSGMQLLPLFAQGPQAIDKILAAARQHGIALSDSQAENAAKFAEGWKSMTAAVDGLRLAIGARLFPVLTPVVTKMTEWLDANRDWIATKLGDAVTKLTAALGRVNWQGVIDGFKSIAEWAGWAVEKIGGVGPALGIIAAISLSPAILAFGQLGRAIAVAAAKWVLFPVAAMIADFVALIPAIGSVTDAFAAFNLVLAANPVGVVVLAVAALATAAYELYEHWEAVSGFFEGLWDGLPGPVRRAVTTIVTEIFPFTAIPYQIYEHWSDLTGLIGRVWDAVVPVVKSAVATLVTEIIPFTAIPYQIYAHWSGLTGFMSNLWGGITATISAAWDKIKGILGAVREAIDWIGARLPGLSRAATAPAEPEAAMRTRFRRALPGAAPAPAEPPGGAITGAAANEGGLPLQALPPLTQLPGAPGAAGAPGPSGETKVKVEFAGTPPGTRISADSTGDTPPPDLAVGYRFAPGT